MARLRQLYPKLRIASAWTELDFGHHRYGTLVARALYLAQPQPIAASTATGTQTDRFDTKIGAAEASVRDLRRPLAIKPYSFSLVWSATIAAHAVPLARMSFAAQSSAFSQKTFARRS
jgi:hypothetical protein